MVNLPGIHVQHGHLGSGNIVEGMSLESGLTIYRPLSNFKSHTANGAAFKQSSFMTLNPATEFDLCIRDEHEWCSVFVPHQLPPSEEDVHEPAQKSNPAASIVTDSDIYTASQFEATIKSILSAAVHQNFENSLAAENAATQIRRLIEPINPRGNEAPTNSIGRPSKHSKRDVIRRCKKFLERNEAQPVRLSELVDASRVSESHLRSIFSAYFGVPPAQYLKLRQYHRIRHALKSASAESNSVTDILLQNGVWEFGRFASRYRTLFGELPSTTLKANSGRRKVP